MTNAIRQGHPNRRFMYRSSDTALMRIQKDAEEAQEEIDMREDQLLLIGMVQNLISYMEGGKKPDGKKFTGGYDKEGCPLPATDIQMSETIIRMINAKAKATVTQLAITDSDYTHKSEVNVFFGQVLQIVKNNVDQETLETIMKGIMQIEQPRTGKGRKRA